MKELFAGSLGALALALTGCASAGSSGSSSGGTSQAQMGFYTSPTEISKTGFQQDPNKYAKNWVTAKGDFDEYKKITIPSYTINFQVYAAKADQNKMSTLLGSGDGSKSILDMKVAFPWQNHQQMLQEVVNTSYGRLKGKLQKIGLEVVEWNDIKSKYEVAQEFEKEKLNMEPIKTDEAWVSIAATGKGRVDSIFWASSALSVSRKADLAVIMPNFAIGMGYFGGEETPQTIKESNGTAGLSFTPQLQIFSGSGMLVASKYEGGNIALDKTAISKENVYKTMDKTGDNRAATAQRGEAARLAVAGYNGVNTSDVSVSTRAGVAYQVQVQPEEYKKALLAQLDAAEDLLVHRYKMELD